MSRFLSTLVKCLLGIVLFAGLPIIGWGIADIAGFVAHPARLSYLVLIALLQIVVVLRFPNAGSVSGAGKKPVSRQRFAVMLLQLFSLAIVFLAPYSDHSGFATLGESMVGRYLGLILAAISFIVMNWAEASLGKQFSVQVTIQEDHQLITAGLYRHLRHPRYLGIIVFNVGVALAFRSWLALALVAALVIVLLWRISDEERLMQQEFGVAWESYTKRSWRLIPFVY